MYIDIRFMEHTDYKKLLLKIRKLLPKGVTLEILDEAPMLLNKDMSMIKVLKSSVEKNTGKKVKLLQEHGASDLRYYSEKGVPSVLFGPHGENYHGKDEFIYLSSLNLYYTALKGFVEDAYMK
jgi:succinyl-diaminopimelate desuccinylase